MPYILLVLLWSGSFDRDNFFPLFQGLIMLFLINISVINLVWHKPSHQLPPNHPDSWIQASKHHWVSKNVGRRASVTFFLSFCWLPCNSLLLRKHFSSFSCFLKIVVAASDGLMMMMTVEWWLHYVVFVCMSVCPFLDDFKKILCSLVLLFVEVYFCEIKIVKQ